MFGFGRLYDTTLAVLEQEALVEKLQEQIKQLELWLSYANARLDLGHHDLRFEQEMLNAKVQIEFLQVCLDCAESVLKHLKGEEKNDDQD